MQPLICLTKRACVTEPFSFLLLFLLETLIFVDKKAAVDIRAAKTVNQPFSSRAAFSCVAVSSCRHSKEAEKSKAKSLLCTRRKFSSKQLVRLYCQENE